MQFTMLTVKGASMINRMIRRHYREGLLKGKLQCHKTKVITLEIGATLSVNRSHTTLLKMAELQGETKCPSALEKLNTNPQRN